VLVSVFFEKTLEQNEEKVFPKDLDFISPLLLLTFLFLLSGVVGVVGVLLQGEGQSLSDSTSLDWVCPLLFSSTSLIMVSSQLIMIKNKDIIQIYI